MRSDKSRVSKSRASSPDGRGATLPISEPFPINQQTSASPNAGQPLAMQKRVRQTIITQQHSVQLAFFRNAGLPAELCRLACPADPSPGRRRCRGRGPVATTAKPPPPRDLGPTPAPSRPPPRPSPPGPPCAGARAGSPPLPRPCNGRGWRSCGLDLAGFAIGLAQQVARVGLAVEAGGRAVDEHYDYEYAIKPTRCQHNAMIISGYIFRAKTPSTH